MNSDLITVYSLMSFLHCNCMLLTQVTVGWTGRQQSLNTC